MKRTYENTLYIELKSNYSDDGPAWIGKLNRGILLKSWRDICLTVN